MASISKKQFQRLIDKHRHYLGEDTDKWRSCKAVVIDKALGEMVIKNANLSHSEFEFTYFEGTTFINVYFSDSIFTDCSFDECKFVGCKFDSAFFMSSEFTDCIFAGSNFDFCAFNDCTIRRSKVMSEELAKDLGVEANKYFPTRIGNNKFYLCEFTEAFTEPINFLKNTMDDCRFYSCDFDLLRALNGGAAKYTVNRSSFRNCYFATSCKNIPDLPLACPSTGAFIAYKKVNLDYPSTSDRAKFSIGNYAIAVLQIPASAKRLSANGNKCRCDKAKVLRFETLGGEKISNPEIYVFTSMHDPCFGYEVGKTVKPESDFNEDRWNECSSGIHFFMNREDAVLY